MASAIDASAKPAYVGVDTMSEPDIPICDESADMKGPTPSSNWVIPLKLIAGAYPGSPTCETKHRDTITAIIDAGSIPPYWFLGNVAHCLIF